MRVCVRVRLRCVKSTKCCWKPEKKVSLHTESSYQQYRSGGLVRDEWKCVVNRKTYEYNSLLISHSILFAHRTHTHTLPQASLSSSYLIQRVYVEAWRKGSVFFVWIRFRLVCIHSFIHYMVLLLVLHSMR